MKSAATILRLKGAILRKGALESDATTLAPAMLWDVPTFQISGENSPRSEVSLIDLDLWENPHGATSQEVPAAAGTSGRIDMTLSRTANLLDLPVDNGPAFLDGRRDKSPARFQAGRDSRRLQ